MRAQPYSPTVNGEICVYRSPWSNAVWLADQAEYDPRRLLRWSALDADSPVCKAAIAAYVRSKEVLASSPMHPEIRNSTICKWAANLAARLAASGQADKAADAPRLAIGLTAANGAMAFERAILLELEPEIANLAEIERMLTVATRKGITGVQPSLHDLRVGLDPSGGMFTQTEQISAIQLQYPALASNTEHHLVECDEQPEAARTRETSTMRLR